MSEEEILRKRANARKRELARRLLTQGVPIDQVAGQIVRPKSFVKKVRSQMKKEQRDSASSLSDQTTN